MIYYNKDLVLCKEHDNNSTCPSCVEKRRKEPGVLKIELPRCPRCNKALHWLNHDKRFCAFNF